jgi:hypothetical protein
MVVVAENVAASTVELEPVEVTTITTITVMLKQRDSVGHKYVRSKGFCSLPIW